MTDRTTDPAAIVAATLHRVRRARLIADVIEKHPGLADDLAAHPWEVRAIGAEERQQIEKVAGLPDKKIRVDSGSYASWVTWTLAACLLGEHRTTHLRKVSSTKGATR